jgi:hypothetical protein
VPAEQVRGGGQIVINHPSFGRGEMRLHAFGGPEPSGPPEGFSVHGAYPNPSTGEVRIALALPSAAEVSAEVYDAAGRRVHQAQPQQLAAGDRQTLTLDGTGLAAGVYTYRVTAQAAERTFTASGTFTVVR